MHAHSYAPTLLQAIVCLGCRLTVRHQDKKAVNIVFNHFFLLLTHVSHHILNHLQTILLYLENKDILVVFNDIWLFISIEV